MPLLIIMRTPDAGSAWFRAPNVLSSFRIALVPLLLLLAWNEEQQLFLVCISVSMFSDLVDGLVARRLNQESELGAKLDSWGDFVTCCSLPVCAWWLWPDVIRREAPSISVVLSCY